MKGKYLLQQTRGQCKNELHRRASRYYDAVLNHKLAIVSHSHSGCTDGRFLIFPVREYGVPGFDSRAAFDEQHYLH
jgi:hypothetical protein